MVKVKKKPVGILELLGIAVGCIRMSHDDFCKCTFEEFESICDAWHEMTEGQYRDSWERARIVAAICIQPHVKKRITPRQLLPLPWDNKKSEIRNNAPSAHIRGKKREV